MLYLMPSRPIPERLLPPKGKWPTPWAGMLLMVILPSWSLLAIRKALSMSRVKTQLSRPYSDLLAMAMASSSFDTRMRGRIGPKISSQASRVSRETSSMVGS